MKLAESSFEVEKNDLGIQQAFTIKATAKAFSILSSGLYTDKIQAILRELCTNALDSQIEAKSTRPFEIHLPTSLEPYFWVEDFGTGLSHEDVLHLYTTYFESTRTHSNDFTGALGLGSKSPFSYVDCFNVTSTFEGMRRTYTAYLDESGLPNITLMSETLCEDSNGIKVSLMVKKDDFSSFKTKLSQVLEFFTGYVVINPPAFWEVVKNQIAYKRDYWSLRVYPGSPRIIQGPIAYPLILKDSDPLQEIFKNLPLDIEVPIGTLEVAASREGLSYTKIAQDKIRELLSKILQAIEEDFKQEIAGEDTEWGKFHKIFKLASKNILYKEVFLASITKFVPNIPIHGSKVHIPNSSLKFLNAFILPKSYQRLKLMEDFDIDLSVEYEFIYNDLSGNYNDILRSYLENRSKTVVFFTPAKLYTLEKIDGENAQKRVILGTVQDSYKNFLEIISNLGNPPYTLLSSVKVPVIEKKAPIRKIPGYILRNGTWKEAIIDEEGEKFYVKLNYLRPEEMGMGELESLMRNFTNLRGPVELYGFSISNMKKSMEKNPKWIPFFPWLKNYIQEELEKNLEAIQVQGVLANIPHFLKEFTFHPLKIEALVDCRLKSLLLEIIRLKNINLSKTSYLRAICRILNIDFPEYELIRNFPEYPLLRCLDGYKVDYHAVVEYVNLIENSRRQ